MAGIKSLSHRLVLCSSHFPLQRQPLAASCAFFDRYFMQLQMNIQIIMNIHCSLLLNVLIRLIDSLTRSFCIPIICDYGGLLFEYIEKIDYIIKNKVLYFRLLHIYSYKKVICTLQFL